MIKHCNTCNQDKDILEFYIAKTSKDGYSSQCKECIKARQAKYNATHKEEQRIRDKCYREENKELIKQRSNSKERKEYEKKYREEHKEQNKEYQREYYIQNRDKVLERQREYYQNNKDKKREYDIRNRDKKRTYIQEYRQQNKDAIKEYDRLRREKNKLSRCLSNQIYHSLKDVKANRHWETLLPYNLQELKEHLESQFTPEMNWDNYGKYGWHIDHIIPQDVFYLLNLKMIQNLKFVGLCIISVHCGIQKI